MSESENVDELFDFLLGDPRLTPIWTDLRHEAGAVLADGRCSDCNGRLYRIDGDVVCGSCSIVAESTSEPSDDDPWVSFRESRSTYSTGVTRCIGGYPHAYEWTESDEVDGAVTDIDPEDFYR